MVVVTSCFSSRHLTEMHSMDPEGARLDAEIGFAMTMADGCTMTLGGRSLPDRGPRYRHLTWTLTPRPQEIP